MLTGRGLADIIINVAESERQKSSKRCTKDGGIAQLGEHLPYKQRVSGSIPDAPTKYGPVVQLVRTLACHARGREFEPHPGRHMLL